MRSLTTSVNKHLLPVFDQPLIHYSLSCLIESGIEDIVIVTDPKSIESLRRQLGCGKRFGVSLQFVPQPQPLGLAHAVACVKDQIGSEPIVVVLGDNIFFGDQVSSYVCQARNLSKGAQIFAVQHDEPSEFGVVEFDGDRVIRLVEKPDSPSSNWIVPGIYIYDDSVWERISQLKPSARGELEITDLNRSYLADGELRVTCLDSSVEWFDAGTPEALFKAGQAAFRRLREGQACGLARFEAKTQRDDCQAESQ